MRDALIDKLPHCLIVLNEMALIFCGAIVEPELFTFFQKKGNFTISGYFFGKNSANVLAFELPNLSKVIKAIVIFQRASDSSLVSKIQKVP